MNCERMETQLIAYVDGRLAAGEHGAVEAHLAECAACRARAAEFCAVWGLLDELPASEPSPAFDARLRARIAAEPRAWWLGWLVPSPQMAAALAVLVLVAVAAVLFAPVAEQQMALGTNGKQEQLTSEEEFRLIRNLPLLEDYDVLAEFEALSALAPEAKKNPREM